MLHQQLKVALTQVGRRGGVEQLIEALGLEETLQGGVHVAGVAEVAQAGGRLPSAFVDAESGGRSAHFVFAQEALGLVTAERYGNRAFIVTK